MLNEEKIKMVMKIKIDSVKIIFFAAFFSLLSIRPALTADTTQNSPQTQTTIEQPAVAPAMQPVPGSPVQEGMGPNTPPGAVIPGEQGNFQNNIPTAQNENVVNDSVETSSVSPITGDEVEKGINIKEERISLDLKGVDINELFRTLSVKMGLTIVPSKSVVGRVNIFLNNLTFENALDVILISQDLAAEKEGSIIKIMTAAEYERLYGKKYNEKRIIKTIKLNYAKPATVFNAISQLKSDIGKIIADESTGTLLLIDIPEKVALIEGAIKELDQPLETEIFDLQYAKPADIKTQLTGVLTVGLGELYVDERSNKAVVSDLPDKMKKIRRMMKALDEPSQQVFIEAEIVQIEFNKEYMREINWEQILTQAALHGLTYGGTFPVVPAFTPTSDLSASNLRMSIGTLAADSYTSTLKILETYGKLKVLSRPRIAVLNNQEAKVMVGTREAYITSTQSQSTDTVITSESVQFIDVGVKLTLTPAINKDGFITLKIKPEVSSVIRYITTDAGSNVPIVKTAEATTIVKVKDGSMVMIAGLMEDTKTETILGIPILAKIPIIGGLFGSRANQNKRAEVIVFITPHIFVGNEQKDELKKIKEDLPADMVWKEAEDIIIEDKLKDAIGGGSAVATKNTETARPKMKGLKKY